MPPLTTRRGPDEWARYFEDVTVVYPVFENEAADGARTLISIEPAAAISG